MIPDQRSLFDIPENISYLNCAYTAPLLKTALAAGENALRAKSHPWKIKPEDFFTNIEKVRGLFAKLIHCSRDDVAITPSVSYGIALAAKNLTFAHGQNIVVLKDQFPSNIYSWKRLAREKGGQIQTVERPLDHNWTKGVIDKIDSKTAIVAIPNIHWTDGTLLVDYRDDYQKGARRFDMGEASNFFLAPVAKAALEQILEWDVKNIAQTLRVKTDYIVQKARSMGLTVPPDNHRAHLLLQGPGLLFQATQVKENLN